MITKVSFYQKSPDAVKTNFISTKKEPTRIVDKTVKDNVHLSREGIQKAGKADVHVQKAKESFKSDALMDPQQKENIEKLIADLKAIQEKSEITEEQKETLRTDLKSTLQGAHKPSQEAVENFVGDFSEIISDGRLDYREILTLQEDINLLLNSADISDEQIEVLKEDFQTIGESSNISNEDLVTLWNDITQIVETARKGINV